MRVTAKVGEIILKEDGDIGGVREVINEFEFERLVVESGEGIGFG